MRRVCYETKNLQCQNYGRQCDTSRIATRQNHKNCRQYTPTVKFRNPTARSRAYPAGSTCIFDPTASSCAVASFPESCVGIIDNAPLNFFRRVKYYWHKRLFFLARFLSQVILRVDTYINTSSIYGHKCNYDRRTHYLYLLNSLNKRIILIIVIRRQSCEFFFMKLIRSKNSVAE